METLTDAVLKSIRKIIRHSELYSHQFRRSSGLTRTQYLLMSEIARHPEATIGKMAETISLSQATATTVLDRLEQAGLAERYRSDQDKRKVHVRLTTEGMAALQSAPAPIYAHFIDRLEMLKPHERTAILSVLQLVGDMMETPEEDPNSISNIGKFPVAIEQVS